MLTASIIYGEDDRHEPLEDFNPILAELAKASVALVPSAAFIQLRDGGAPKTAGDRLGWCADERFYDQPSLATCSGVLIEDDLVLTAGHCIRDDNGCFGSTFLGGYYYGPGGRPPALESLVSAECELIVTMRIDSALSTEGSDYAVVQLDRALGPRPLLQIRTLAPQLGEPIVTVGASAGLPVKITSGHVVGVNSLSVGYFDFTSDVFAGGSGSGVYDLSGALLGHHARGGRDYEITNDGCLVAHVVNERDAGTSEQGNPIREVLKAICDVQPGRSFCIGDAGGRNEPSADASTDTSPSNGPSGPRRTGGLPERLLSDPFDAIEPGSESVAEPPGDSEPPDPWRSGRANSDGMTHLARRASRACDFSARGRLGDPLAITIAILALRARQRRQNPKHKWNS